jgi:iron complex outermembrane recepter protein
MIKKKQLVVAIAATFVASGLAYAQTPQKVEKVEVTGSNIKRIDAEGTAPIQIITREDIERSGSTTIAEVLQKIPSANAGTFNEAAVASFSPGASSTSLRGLGGSATLVLINGRRIAPFGFASGGQTTFVDLNSIPLSAVERIEVLLDGASAIYGSEAMAGVINVIMRKDFNGISLTASGGMSSRSDANGYSASIAGGFGNVAKDGYNLFGVLSYGTQDRILASDRPNTRTADYRRFGSLDRRSTYTNPGNAYNAANTAFVGALAGCSPLGTSADGGLNGRCLYDFAQTIDLVPKSERIAAFFSGVKSLGANAQLFGDLSLTSNKVNQGSASYNVATYGYNGVILRANHPQNTFGQDVAVRYRLNDVPLSVDVKSDTIRAVLGAKATFGTWDTEAAFLYSGSNTDVKEKGFTRDSVLANEFLVPDTNVVQNNVRLGALSPELRARLYPELKNNGKTSVTMIDAKASTELMTLPGGPMGVAFGLDTRREAFKSVPDKLIQEGDIGALGSSSADGSRTVSAAYAELSAPVVRGVETQLAGRYDRYSTFGGKFTPKFAVKWTPLTAVALRGSYTEGFRAPSLTETSSSPTRGFFNNIRDPRFCPVPSETNPACSQQTTAESGSNPNLKPETSKSYNFGVVFEPTKDLSVAVDFYNIKRKNEITSLDVEYLLANESLYPQYVIRDGTGALIGIKTPYENLGSTNVKGVDLDVRSSFSLGAAGKLKLTGVYNYMPTYKVRPVKDAEELNYAGTYLQPTERLQLTANWTYGVWDTTVSWNKTGAYLRAFTPSDLSCALSQASKDLGLCSVSSWSTTDVVARYTGVKDLTLTLGVRNIDNRQPPLDQRRETRFTFYSPTYHNALGRYVTLSARYDFR